MEFETKLAVTVRPAVEGAGTIREIKIMRGRIMPGYVYVKAPHITAPAVRKLLKLAVPPVDLSDCIGAATSAASPPSP